MFVEIRELVRPGVTTGELDRAIEARIREAGYKTITLDVSEFQKLDGGLSCLSLRF